MNFAWQGAHSAVGQISANLVNAINAPRKTVNPFVQPIMPDTPIPHIQAQLDILSAIVSAIFAHKCELQNLDADQALQVIVDGLVKEKVDQLRAQHRADRFAARVSGITEESVVEIYSRAAAQFKNAGYAETNTVEGVAV